MKHPRRPASRHKIEAPAGVYLQAAVAGRKGPFLRQGLWHSGRRQPLPPLAIPGVQNHEPSIERVAQRIAVGLRQALERIQKKLFALIGILELPARSPVRRLVDPRLRAFSARHQIGLGLVKYHHAAKIEILATFDPQSLPWFSQVTSD